MRKGKYPPPPSSSSSTCLLLARSLTHWFSISLYVFMYIYMCMWTYAYVCTHMHTDTAQRNFWMLQEGDKSLSSSRGKHYQIWERYLHVPVDFCSYNCLCLYSNLSCFLLPSFFVPFVIEMLLWMKYGEAIELHLKFTKSRAKIQGFISLRSEARVPAVLRVAAEAQLRGSFLIHFFVSICLFCEAGKNSWLTTSRLRRKVFLVYVAQKWY